MAVEIESGWCEAHVCGCSIDVTGVARVGW